jgi:hypothetical protein
MSTPQELRQAYLDAQVEVEIEPEDWVPIDIAVRHLPTPLHLITAWNPMSQQLSLDENNERMDQLAAALDDLAALWFPAVGKSPDGTWSENTFAVYGISRDQALEIGVQFEQHAIFEATDEEQIVLGCYEPWEERRFLEIGDADTGTPAMPPRRNLSAEIADTLGFKITSTLVRASYDGWEHEGSCGAVCRTCDAELELFGCTAAGRSGMLNRLIAFVCPGCRALLWPHDVDASTRECAKLWRKFLFAQQEAMERHAKETYYAYVIELEGEVDTRSTGSDPELPWLYVGQSAKPPAERLQQHLEGYKASRWVTRFGSHLRTDLYEGHPTLRNRLSALAYETWLAESLWNKGFPIKGGH